MQDFLRVGRLSESSSTQVRRQPGHHHRQCSRANTVAGGGSGGAGARSQTMPAPWSGWVSNGEATTTVGLTPAFTLGDGSAGQARRRCALETPVRVVLEAEQLGTRGGGDTADTSRNFVAMVESSQVRWSRHDEQTGTHGPAGEPTAPHTPVTEPRGALDGILHFPVRWDALSKASQLRAITGLSWAVEFDAQADRFHLVLDSESILRVQASGTERDSVCPPIGEHRHDRA